MTRQGVIGINRAIAGSGTMQRLHALCLVLRIARLDLPTAPHSP